MSVDCGETVLLSTVALNFPLTVVSPKTELHSKKQLSAIFQLRCRTENIVEFLNKGSQMLLFNELD